MAVLPAKRFRTALRVLRTQGPLALARMMARRWLAPVAAGPLAWAGRSAAARILREHAGRPVFILVSTVDYHFPYRQRQQHLAAELARAGCLCFYASAGSGYDPLAAFTRVEDGLYLTPLWKLALDLAEKPTVILISTERRVNNALIDDVLGRGGKLVYDYIDHVDEAVSLVPLSEHFKIAHDRLLRDERVYCVASAGKLIDEVAQLRQRNYRLITNGVDVAHFAVARDRAALDPPFRKIVDTGRLILGYHGALASWFDYDLVFALAEKRPDDAIVLIGFEHDNSLREIARALPPNLVLLPPVPYAELPRYATFFDVCMIPFKVNAITAATSPLKLFEYMALGKPIVTTALPECAGYRATLVARDADHFIVLIAQAAERRDDADYRMLVRQEAEANSWSAKAAELLAFLGANGRP